ncbi:uncharacterized protein SPSC_01364 [Sporisorium scitamineum]|uniref:Uncharacterized protein n=1 Tax=Sporisorium scitamineum TaxID=49012 RepID=A0A127Z9J0_9BASI|nr:uncharacterized protein SPSC_01364 [Sporisorium scitamineum]
MSTSFTEAGPSRLSINPTSMRCARPVRHVHLLDRSALLLTPSYHTADEDEEVSRAGSIDLGLDSSSDHASSFGFGSVPTSASHRSVPFSLRPMASEMVRPPEVVRPTPPERCPSVMR